MNRRGLRLRLVAGLGGLLLGLSVAADAQTIGTTTTMTASSASASSCSLTTLSVAVTGTTGTPTGTVTVLDSASGSPVALASQALSTSGQATFVLALPNGTHTLTASYGGSATYNTSISTSVSQTVSSQCSSSFVVTVSSLSPSNTLTAGQAGTATVTVTPLSSFVPASTGSPAFITLSCSGLPNQTSCTFSPANLEILPGQAGGVTSSLVLQTQAAGTTARLSPGTTHNHGGQQIAWAILLPGALGLGGLAWGARKNAWLNRLALVALVALVTTLGTTGCNPRYYYYNHGPPNNPATPSGTFTVTVTGQSSNGITAITQNTTFQLIVN